MGKAIIVPGADFSSLGIGKVNFSGAINAPKVIVGQTYALIATMDDAAWDVEDDTYAEINSSTGVLTIKSGAWNNEVVVTATKGSESASATIKVFYSTLVSQTFEAASVIDQSSNIRNGSMGNSGNTKRVGSNKTFDTNGYKFAIISTTRPNASGYKYFNLIGGYTVEVDTTTGTTTCNSSKVFEFGTKTVNNKGIEIEMGNLLPLTEDDTSSEYFHQSSQSGSTPVSFAITIDELLPDGNVDDNTHAIRANDFTGYAVKVTLFK